MLNEAVVCESGWYRFCVFGARFVFFNPVLSSKVCVAVMSVENLPVFVLCVEGGVLVSVHLPLATAGNLVAISDQHPTRHRAWWKTGYLWTRKQLCKFLC